MINTIKNLSQSVLYINTEKELKEKVLSIENTKSELVIKSSKTMTESQINEYFNLIDSLDYKIYDSFPFDNINDCVGPLDKNEFTYFIQNVSNNGNFLCVHKDNIKKYNLPNKIKDKTCVIVFGRNDGYKEKERFIIHITRMLETFDEVIYVDWNSEKRSFLYEIIDDIPKTGRLKHFVIEPKIKQINTQCMF